MLTRLDTSLFEGLIRGEKPTPVNYLVRANRLVAALPAPLQTLLLKHSTRVDLQQHEVLTQAGQAMEYAYFPIDSFVAAVHNLNNERTVQVALIGNEGMVNVGLILGMRVASLTSAVQGSGRAYRIGCAQLQFMLETQPFLREILHRYAAFSMDSVALNMVCASCHTVEQRLSRWLLMARDRACSSEMRLTHEALAFMLGVRRERVNQAAISLQDHGLISYRRGEVILLDEGGLEATACKCYRTGIAAYDQTMGKLVSDQEIERGGPTANKALF